MNAVLRAVADGPDRIGDDLAESYPDPVIGMLVADLGESDAKRFLEASNEPAPVGVRLRGGTESPARYLSPGESIEDVGPRDAVDVIDPASYSVARALDAQPGDRVVDLAAAPGGKTRIIADAMEGAGMLVACDLHPRRLRDAARRSRAFPIISWIRADAARPPFRDQSFDRVLLDAPCTGLGTMRRRPEIRDRVRPGAATEYGTLQRTMVERAIDLVRPGGRLVLQRLHRDARRNGRRRGGPGLRRSRAPVGSTSGGRAPAHPRQGRHGWDVHRHPRAVTPPTALLDRAASGACRTHLPPVLLCRWAPALHSPAMRTAARIAPSILAGDFARLSEDVDLIADVVDLLHVDVMDGHFVPNISLGPPVIGVVACRHRPLPRLPLDDHRSRQIPGTLEGVGR